jgi:putative DNA primase/helicase
MKTVDQAKGRWSEILTGLGHADALSTKHTACPACGGEDRYRYLDDEFGGFFCGSLRGDGIGLIKHLRDCTDKEAFALVESIIGKTEFDQEPRVKSYAQMLQVKAVKAPRSAYLESRGLDMPPNLYFAKGVKYFVDGKPVGLFDAMLAPFSKDGRFITFQATYLHKGKKAPVPEARKTLSTDQSMSGGAVELYPAGEVLGIAEGVETAIACHMMSDIPVWASLSASLMRGFNPPKGVRKVVIYADNDANWTGQASAWHLGNRLMMLGYDVEIQIPKVEGEDWWDVFARLMGITRTDKCDTIKQPESLESVVNWANQSGAEHE